MLLTGDMTKRGLAKTRMESHENSTYLRVAGENKIDRIKSR